MMQMGKKELNSSCTVGTETKDHLEKPKKFIEMAKASFGVKPQQPPISDASTSKSPNSKGCNVALRDKK